MRRGTSASTHWAAPAEAALWQYTNPAIEPFRTDQRGAPGRAVVSQPAWVEVYPEAYFYGGVGITSNGI
eukprot:7512822-Pyramimonas_sp.AAC.1